MAYFPPTGSVVAFQSDPTKLLTHASVSGNIAVTNIPSISGTVNIGIIPGSIIAFPTGNQSVSGAVSISNLPTNQNVSGSVVAFVSGTVPVNAAGSVVAFQGTSPWVVDTGNRSVITLVQGSIAVAVTPAANQSVSGVVGASIIGLPNVNVAGSVVGFQGTSPWVVNFQNSSILATPVGSVITIVQANSIVGTYAEDAAHATAEKGLFILGVRNDTVASFVSANLDYGPMATDAAGRPVVKPFAPEEARIEGYASVVSTSVTTLVAAAGTGLRNYITDIILANTGATTTLITFRSGGGTSVLGYGIAPTGGGSNMIGFQTPLRTQANETFDFQATSSSSILFATVKGFKAP